VSLLHERIPFKNTLLLSAILSQSLDQDSATTPGWYEGSRRKAKAFPTKALAEHFRYIKCTQLNSDVFTSVVDFDWHQMVELFLPRQGEPILDAILLNCLLRASEGHEVFCGA